MRKFLLLVLFVLDFSFSQYISGDLVRDVSFTDSNVDSNMTILYSEQSIKELISSSKVIVISFFGPG